MSNVHVIPLNDSDEHIRSLFCECQPWLDQGGAIVHNAFDGREVIERFGMHDPDRKWLVQIMNDQI